MLICPVLNCYKQFKKEFSVVKIEAYTSNIVNIYSFEKAWKLKTTLIKNTEMKVFLFKILMFLCTFDTATSMVIALLLHLCFQLLCQVDSSWDIGYHWCSLCIC